MPPKLDSELKTLRRHDEYYIAGADLCILVEHIHFRVHRYFFERESNWFKSRLLIPASPGAKPQGSDDSNAIILPDLTPAEFAKFLWVFYNPKYSLYDAEVEDWTTILALSHRWSFPEVKALAVRELEIKPMLDVKRIKLYHETDVDRNFLIPRYAALIEREEPLTLAEGMDLGMETTLQIAKGREEARAARLPSGVRSPLTPTVRGADLHEVVRELFKIAPSATLEGEEQEEVPQPVNGFHTSGALKKTKIPPPSLAPAQLPSPPTESTEPQSTSPPPVPPKTPTVQIQEQKVTPATPKTPTTNTNKGNKAKGPKGQQQPQTPQIPRTAQPPPPQPTTVKAPTVTPTTTEEERPAVTPSTTTQTKDNQELPPPPPVVVIIKEENKTTTITTTKEAEEEPSEAEMPSQPELERQAAVAVGQQQGKEEGEDREKKVQGSLSVAKNGNGTEVVTGEIKAKSAEEQQQPAADSTTDAATTITTTAMEGGESAPSLLPLPDATPLIPIVVGQQASPLDQSQLSADQPKTIFRDSAQWNLF